MAGIPYTKAEKDLGGAALVCQCQRGQPCHGDAIIQWYVDMKERDVVPTASSKALLSAMASSSSSTEAASGKRKTSEESWCTGAEALPKYGTKDGKVAEKPLEFGVLCCLTPCAN